MWYTGNMSNDLQELFERANRWPIEAREELVALGREIEGEVSGGYHATPEEVVGIDRGIKAASEDHFADPSHVESALLKFRVR